MGVTGWFCNAALPPWLAYVTIGLIPYRSKRVTTETMTDNEGAVKNASQHLYEAMTHHFGPLDLGAHQPLVKAISEYGTSSRARDDEGVKRASTHVYEALTHHFGPRDLGAHDPVVMALAEYGKACREAGPKA